MNWQSIASKLREPQHATPPILQEVTDLIKGQNHPKDSAHEAKKSTSSTKEPRGTKNSPCGAQDQQEWLTENILAEGLEKVDRKPLEKQAELKSGTPTEVIPATA